MKKHKIQASVDTGSGRVLTPLVLLTALFSLLLGMVLTLGVLFLRLDRDALSVLQAASIIRAQFVGDYDWHEVANSSMRQMVNALDDRWSYFLSAEEFQQVEQSRKNAYVGIGITISRETKEHIEIVSVTPNGPAARAGLQANDTVIAVNDVTVTPENYQSCVDTIGGEPGGEVRLELAGSGGLSRTVELLREEIVSIPVTQELLPNGVGYISLRNFYSGSADALIEAVDALTQEGAHALVFDLRDNPGGYVTELTQMLDYLLPAGVIFQSFDIKGEQQLYSSDESSVDLPFAVLVNANSYSAAEFFAAQLRESNGTYIAGETTSGKGYAQQLFPLQNGSAIGLSTSRYVTGSGVSLIGVGLLPDAELGLSAEQEKLLLQGKLPHGQDAQLQAALEALATQMS